MLKNGEGVQADPRQAVIWFERASSQNHPDAHYHLGGLYAQGHGGEDGKRRAMSKLEAVVNMNHEGAARVLEEWRRQTGR
jgi:TPR repeat protein